MNETKKLTLLAIGVAVVGYTIKFIQNWRQSGSNEAVPDRHDTSTPLATVPQAPTVPVANAPNSNPSVGLAALQESATNEDTTNEHVGGTTVGQSSRQPMPVARQTNIKPNTQQKRLKNEVTPAFPVGSSAAAAAPASDGPVSAEIAVSFAEPTKKDAGNISASSSAPVPRLLHLARDIEAPRLEGTDAARLPAPSLPVAARQGDTAPKHTTPASISGAASGAPAESSTAGGVHVSDGPVSAEIAVSFAEPTKKDAGNISAPFPGPASRQGGHLSDVYSPYKEKGTISAARFGMGADGFLPSRKEEATAEETALISPPNSVAKAEALVDIAVSRHSGEEVMGRVFQESTSGSAPASSTELASFDIAPSFLTLSAHEEAAHVKAPAAQGELAPAALPREPVATPPAHQLSPHQPPTVRTPAQIQNPPADYTEQIAALRLLSPPAPRAAQSSADLEDLESTAVASVLQHTEPIASDMAPQAAEMSAVKSPKAVSLVLTDGKSKVKHPTEEINGITSSTTLSQGSQRGGGAASSQGSLGGGGESVACRTVVIKNIPRYTSVMMMSKHLTPFATPQPGGDQIVAASMAIDYTTGFVGTSTAKFPSAACARRAVKSLNGKGFKSDCLIMDDARNVINRPMEIRMLDDGGGGSGSVEHDGGGRGTGETGVTFRGQQTIPRGRGRARGGGGVQGGGQRRGASWKLEITEVPQHTTDQMLRAQYASYAEGGTVGVTVVRPGHYGYVKKAIITLPSAVSARRAVVEMNGRGFDWAFLSLTNGSSRVKNGNMKVKLLDSGGDGEGG